MESASSSLNVEQEAECPICKEGLTDPVTLDCGHNYCRGCITNYYEIWEKLKVGEVLCPVCRVWIQERNWKDATSHPLETLRKKQDEILAYKAKLEKKSQELLKLTETERQKVLDEFRQLHQFIEEHKEFLLNEMEKMKEEIVAKRDELIVKLSKELMPLQRSIQEMEEKQHQEAAGELLKDVKQIMQRDKNCEAFENPMDFCPEMKKRISDTNLLLKNDVKQFTDVLEARMYQKANITLDPDTASPWLILSEDCKSVRRCCLKEDLPDNPERFNSVPFVLGREGFTKGRHFWEVSVGSEVIWAVGVARKSVMRKRFFPLSLEEGTWAVGKWKGKYKAFNPPDNSFLALNETPQKIRVTLNYGRGEVYFFDADTGSLIFTFTGASFSGEILPLFCMWEGSKTPLTLM